MHNFIFIIFGCLALTAIKKCQNATDTTFPSTSETSTQVDLTNLTPIRMVHPIMPPSTLSPVIEIFSIQINIVLEGNFTPSLKNLSSPDSVNLIVALKDFVS